MAGSTSLLPAMTLFPKVHIQKSFTTVGPFRRDKEGGIFDVRPLWNDPDRLGLPHIRGVWQHGHGRMGEKIQKWEDLLQQGKPRGGEKMSMMDEKIGWRGKIGLIVNSGQIVTEPLYNRLAPLGVSFFASRILVERGVLEDHASMEKDAFRAGRELASAGVDCIVYCCTFSGILQGVEGNKKFCLQMEKETGIPTTSTLSAILEGMETLKLKKLVLISPYQEQQHAAEEKFFQATGFHIVKSESMNIDSRMKVPLVSPGEIYRFCRRHWDQAADGLLISCMNFNALPSIAPLERDLGKPVVSSHSATLWRILRMIRVRENIPECGRLMAEGLQGKSNGEPENPGLHQTF